MMTEPEWQAAERRDPDKAYVQPENNRRWMIALAWLCFLAMPIGAIAPAVIIFGPDLALAGADADHAQNVKEGQGYQGQKDKWGMCICPTTDTPQGSGDPQYIEGTGGQGGNQFTSPDIGKSGDGMTGGDAYYLVQPEQPLQGDEVNSLTLSEAARGEDVAGVEVQQVPHFYYYYPRAWVFDSFGDFARYLTH